eukprot:TRINITY_DN2604_c0_g1_i8.p1 TRINITY_DN2604_c0_g1~~TRINITY_DN2604_c0_g1_i8.p1  ORF type:complete len:267 (-),score=0.16 TRINITY_DN2604_c0_g1_i8:37-837(-)
MHALRRFYKRFHRELLVATVLCSMLPAIGIFIRALIRPGPHYCNYSNGQTCPISNLQTEIPDNAMIPICGVLFAVSTTCAGIVLGASGAWITTSYKYKSLALSCLFFVLWGIVQLAATSANRAYIIPYDGTYCFGVDQDRAVHFNHTGTWDDGRIEFLALDAGLADNPWTLDPLANIAVLDSWSSGMDASGRGIPVDSLRPGTSYMFVAVPATKGDDRYAFMDGYLIRTNHALADRVYVDMRAFVKCVWDGSGCSGASPAEHYCNR